MLGTEPRSFAKQRMPLASEPLYSPSRHFILKEAKILDLYENLSYILNIDDLFKNFKTVGSGTNTSGEQMWL